MVLFVGKTAESLVAAPPQPEAMFLRRRRAPARFAGNQEPAIAEILTDPILHRLLASDGVRSDHLIDLIADVKVRLARKR